MAQQLLGGSKPLTQEPAVTRPHPTRSAVAALTVGGAALLASVAAQGAVVYQGVWDPAFGADFPTMGWRAEAQVVINDSCVTELEALGGFTGRLEGELADDFAACRADEFGNGGIRMTGLTLGFYDFVSDGLSTEVYEATNDLILLDDDYCFEDCFRWLDFVDGALVGLQTEFSSYLAHTLIGAGFASDFLNPCSGEQDTRPSTDFSFQVRLGVGASATSSVAWNYFSECGSGESERQPDTVTLVRLPSQVPEPGSILLTLSALGLALRLSRRRG